MAACPVAAPWVAAAVAPGAVPRTPTAVVDLILGGRRTGQERAWDPEATKRAVRLVGRLGRRVRGARPAAAEAVQGAAVLAWAAEVGIAPRVGPEA